MTTTEELHNKRFKLIHESEIYKIGDLIQDRPINNKTCQLLMIEYYLYTNMHRRKEYVIEIIFKNKNKELIKSICLFPSYIKYLKCKVLKDLAYVTINFVCTDDVRSDKVIRMIREATREKEYFEYKKTYAMYEREMNINNELLQC